MCAMVCAICARCCNLRLQKPSWLGRAPTLPSREVDAPPGVPTIWVPTTRPRGRGTRRSTDKFKNSICAKIRGMGGVRAAGPQTGVWVPGEAPPEEMQCRQRRSEARSHIASCISPTFGVCLSRGPWRPLAETPAEVANALKNVGGRKALCRGGRHGVSSKRTPLGPPKGVMGEQALRVPYLPRAVCRSVLSVPS